MAGSWALESARRDLELQAVAGLDSRPLRRAYLQRLRRLIPFDSAWFAMADPATLLFTDSIRDEMPSQATPLFVEDEFLRDDFNKWAELAAAGSHANGLELAAGGDLTASYRFREILEPLGLGDELRASLLADGVCWGFICLHRGRGEPSFSGDEARWLAVLAPTMAEGLRLSLVTQAAGAGAGDVGVILLAEDLSLIGMSGQAEQWLAQIRDEDWPSGNELPPVLLGVASRLRAAEAGTSVGAARARVQTGSGAWLQVQASRLVGETATQTAVLLVPAGTRELAPLIMEAYTFTHREAEIVQLVLSGRSTKEIATSLRISDLTVQQHLKSVFEKAGVRTRRELTAQVFGTHYQPRIRAGERLGTDGFFSR